MSANWTMPTLIGAVKAAQTIIQAGYQYAAWVGDTTCARISGTSTGRQPLGQGEHLVGHAGADQHPGGATAQARAVPVADPAPQLDDADGHGHDRAQRPRGDELEGVGAAGRAGPARPTAHSARMLPSA